MLLMTVPDPADALSHNLTVPDEVEFTYIPTNLQVAPATTPDAVKFTYTVPSGEAVIESRLLFKAVSRDVEIYLPDSS